MDDASYYTKSKIMFDISDLFEKSNKINESLEDFKIRNVEKI